MDGVSSVVCNPVGDSEDKAPERALNAALRRVSLLEIYWSTLLLQVVKHLHELLMRLEAPLINTSIVLLNQQVGLVVAVEAPMVLIETAQSHQAPIIDLDCLHVQELEGLLMHHCSLTLQLPKEVRVEEAFVARLIPVASRYYFNLDIPFLHRLDQFVL